MSKKEDRDKVKSYDSLVDTINSVGYNVSGDIETFILCELKRLRDCKEKYEWLVRKIEEEEEDAEAYNAEKEAAKQAELDKLKAEEEAKKAAEEAAASGEEQPKENKVTKIASGFLGVVVLIALAAGGGFYAFTKQKQKKQAEKEALDPDANYTEDKGDFEIPVEDEPEETGEEDNAEE